MQMLQQHLAKGLHAVHWFALLLGSADSGCVDDGVCAYHNFKIYKTLDGTLRDASSYGCQSGYLALPGSWDIATSDNDGVHVATSYNWGTQWILHSTSCCYSYSGTKTYAGRRRSPSLQITTSTSNGETTYGVSSCNSRILIRKWFVNCSSGRGLPVIEVGNEPECSECTTGQFSDGGVDVDCLPMVAHAAEQLTNTPPFDFYVESDEFGIVRVGISTVAPPEVLYEGVSLEYSIDIKPNATALDLQGASACQQSKWSSITAENLINFTSVLTYSELNEDCKLNLTIVEDKVQREGIVAVALIIKDADGAFEGTVMTWYHPILIELPSLIEAIYNPGLIAAGSGERQDSVTYAAEWAGSTLKLFESDAFQTTKSLPIYQAGDRAFAELTLIDSAGLILTPVEAWISSSKDSSQGRLYNLTDSIVFIGYGTAGTSQVRFSTVLQPCVNCYLHVVGDITSRRLEDADDNVDAEERRLELSSMHHTQQSVLITVEEVPINIEDPGRGSEDEGNVLATFMIGAGVIAALLFGVGACLLMTRCKREVKYARAATHDQEATPASPPPAPAAPAPAAAATRAPQVKKKPTVASI